MRLLVTGGAGFVGSALCLMAKRSGLADAVVALDNLKRRGSERNIPLLQAEGVRFVHGDVRSPDDFAATGGTFDLAIDAAAEPSVLAGTDGDGIRYLFDTNLLGTLNLLEFCRRRAGSLIFLSSSRVYSIRALRDIRLREGETRLHPAGE